MTRFFLVRHGQTVWHAENRYCGVSDIDLSPTGHDQAARLGDWARTARLDAIWVSPLRRARDTAGPVAEAVGLAPRVEPRLRELDFGLGEGLTSAQMASEFPQAWAAFLADPVRDHLPDGERPESLVSRASEAFAELTGLHPEARVLVIAHTTLIRLMLCHWMGIPLSSYRRTFPSLENVGLTEFDLGPAGFALRRFNVPLIAAERRSAQGSAS